MTFETLVKKPPVKVKTLRVTLEFNDPDVYIGRYKFVLVDEDGKKVSDPIESGDLLPHLSDQEKIDLKAFMDTQLTKVEGRLG